MKAVKNMNLSEFAVLVYNHLKKKGIRCVLTGGACVSIYTDNQYQSYDLDFIDETESSRKEVNQALSEIGFFEENRYFRHPDTKFFVEFPSGPLSVGSEPVKNIVTLKFPSGQLKLLSPTDCVKDRLSAYYHWNDRQSLEQALLVARNQKIDLKEIRRWSKHENKLREFNLIQKLFNNNIP